MIRPCVLRPCSGTESAATRVTCPPAVTIMTSSASSTSSAHTTGETSAPAATARVPRPPLFCRGKSDTGVRLPDPSSLTVSTVLSRRIISMPTTSSSLRVMPFTPCAVRPTTVISSSGKRIALPDRESNMTSAVASDSATSRITSPSLTPAALTPPALVLANSETAVRFTTPSRERKTRYRSSTSRWSSGIIDTMRSLRSAPSINA